MYRESVGRGKRAARSPDDFPPPTAEHAVPGRSCPVSVASRMPRYQRVPPRRPLPWSTTLRTWAAMLGAGALLALLVAWSERLPEPASATAPATEFSALRAWPALAQLADSTGYRVTGTGGNDRARAWLVAQLRALPGIEVQEQDAVGVRPIGQTLRVYRVRNVLARVRGRGDSGAVLLSSHYDSPASSVGAADAGVAIAVMLEVARALAQGPPLAHDVILHLNDGEEQGLLGAHAFVAHPWARDVRAFVNLESAGTDGKAILFQAGPGNEWLTRRYARSAPHPYGSVIGQDIFQSGFIPSATDFEIYVRDGGLRGLDVAFYRGGYRYHTHLDRTEAVAPGSVQHMGANTLALVRALAAGPLPGDVGGTASVYYDLLGATMIAHGRPVAWALTAAATLLLLVALPAALRRHRVPARLVWRAVVYTLLGVVGALALTVLAAAAGPYMLGRAHGWFAHPLRAVVAYGGVALAVLVLAQWGFGRGRRALDVAPDARWLAAWSAALLLHLALLLGFTILGIGSGYLFGWWVACGALGCLLLAASSEGRWRLAAAVGMVPAAVLTLQVGSLLVLLFVPVAGRFPLSIPFDPVLGAIVAVSAVALLAAPVTLLQRGERVGVAAAIAIVVALGGLATVWGTFPYAADRPQRLALVHEDGAGEPRLVAQTLDWPGVAHAVEAVGAWPMGAARVAGRSEASWPAPPLERPPAQLELLAERPTAEGRELDVRVRPVEAYRVGLRAPNARQPRWRVGGEPTTDLRAAPRLTLTGSAPGEGWTVTIAVRGSDPLRLDVEAQGATPSTATRQLMKRLPDWIAASGQTMVRSNVTF